MKRMTITMAVSLFTAVSFAQTEKYTKAMEAIVPSVDTTRSREALVALSNSFERIANAEKTQWLPFYYAALTQISAAYTFAMDGGFGDKTADIDPMADKAEDLLKNAEALSKDNSEIWCVRKMLASVRMMGNPMVRYQEYGAKATAALETAKKLNADNPRVYMLEGQDLFFTPEEFGGDKQEAKKRFETAIEKFKAQKPESSIHPVWGMGQTMYFHSQIK
jgi:hypothetical protein